jgi:alpha-glucosidase
LKQIRLYNEDLPGVHEIVREIRSVLDSYGERVLIGEIYLPVERLVHYYGKSLDEAHLPFNFQLFSLPCWEASVLRQVIDTYEGLLPTGAWPNWVLSNHDRPRIATRIGKAQSRNAQMLLLTLRGTPTCYYGDELGMENVPLPLAMIHDPQGKDYPALSRDPARTPMQWDASANAGFCSSHVTPWLPVSEDYRTNNVAVSRKNIRSFLMFTRTLLELRRLLPALKLGSYKPIDQDNPACFVYERGYQKERYLVVLNLSDEKQTLHLAGKGRVLLTTHMDFEGTKDLADLYLRGNEGMLIELL